MVHVVLHHPRGRARGERADALALPERVLDLVDGRVDPVHDPGAVERLDEGRVHGELRARDRRAEILQAVQQQRAGVLRQRAALVDVVLHHARAAQVEALAVQQDHAARPHGDLLDAERQAVGAAHLVGRDGADGQPVQLGRARRPEAWLLDGELRPERAPAERRDRLRVVADVPPVHVHHERDVAVALREVPQRGPHLDLRRAAHAPQPRQDVHVLHVDRVHVPHVDLAQDPAEVPPAARAVAVVGGRTPVREVGVAPQRRDLDDQRVAALLQVLQGHLEREVARVDSTQPPAVEPQLGAVVVALEADLPELAGALLRRALRLRHRELLAVPADRRAVLGGVGRVPVVRDRDGAPAREVVLRVPALVLADEAVVAAEVPGAAQELPVHLTLADQRLAAGLLHAQLGRHGRGYLR